MECQFVSCHCDEGVEYIREILAECLVYFHDLSHSRLEYDSAMKPLPAPPVPGKTEAERFDNAVRKTFTVSK